MNSDNSSENLNAHAYYPIIFILPIYVLFGFFPFLVNIPMYKVPHPDFFPSFNNYWSLANTGIESFLLTILAFLYILLNLYLTRKRDLSLIKVNNVLQNYILFSFILIFLTIWISSNLKASNFYWQFQEYQLYNFNSWLFFFFYTCLFYIAIVRDDSKRRLYSYIVLIFFCSILPVGFLQQYDLEFFAIPALGILNKVDISSVYFQYDLLIPLLIALWDMIGFEIYNFYVFLNLVLFIYLIGLYKLLDLLIRSKYILILASFTIVFLRFYLIDMKFGSVFVQYSPLRADLWLLLALVAAICGIKSKRLFATLIIVLIFSFNMGILYSIAYFVTLFVISLFEAKMNILSAFVSWIKQNLIKLVIFITVFSLIYIYVYSFGENIGTKQFLKYSIQSNKIQKFSIIWLALLFMGLLSSNIALKISGIRKEKLNTYVFLIFLTIVNFTFCFYKNTILSFISVSTSFLILFFIYIDLNSKFFKSFSQRFSKFKIIKVMPIILLLFPLAFNKYGVPTIINNQYRFLASNSAFKARKINTDVKQINHLKKILAAKDKVIIYGAGSYIQYFELDIAPIDYFLFTSNAYNAKEYKLFLKLKVEEGFLLIFPKSKVTPWGYPRKEYFEFWSSILDDNKSFSIFSDDKFDIIYLNQFHNF
ncbi:hypothetical protein HOG00_02065 [bacterium]|nr:hypothetical protein [bacterium]